MKKSLVYFTLFALGTGFGATLTAVNAAEQAGKQAYMIVSSDPKPEADYSAYRAAAGPLARAAGLKILAARKEPLVLEGSWPYKNVTLEVFPSMQAVKEFWYSQEYQEAKKLRDNLSTVNFIVAIEAD